MSGLRKRLEAETADAHARLGTVPFFRALHAGELPKSAIVSLLRSLSIIHAALERTLSRSSSSVLAALHRHAPSKGELLAADLEAIGAQPFSSVTPAIRAALEYASEIITDGDELSSLVGALYVLEGSQNDANKLKHAYARCLSIADEQLSYIGCYGTDTAAHWTAFGEYLNSLPMAEAEMNRARRSAMHCLERLEAICTVLYPYAERDLEHHAAEINVEAGAHAIPQDPLDIALALQARSSAWEQYRYLAHRYGERGRRFTMSDSCWLVVLARMSPASVTKNLEWLRGVLASRGIPTVILEAHLVAISRALAQGTPDQARFSSCFEPFLSRCAAGRRQFGAADRMADLVDGFNRRLRACPGPTVDSAAGLITSAWFDERSGIAGALAATREWFVDAGRFSADWIGIVDELVTTLDRTARLPC